MIDKAFFAIALSSAFTGVSAFWRMECRGRTSVALVDPIMDFGKAATHAHSLHGSSGK